MSATATQPKPAASFADTARALLTMLALVTAVGGVLLQLNPSWGPWARYGVPTLCGAGLLLALIAVTGIRLGLSNRRSGRLVESFAPVMGGDGWDAAGQRFRASRFSKGRPQRITIDYPDHLPDYDPQWRAKVETVARERMGAEVLKTQWNAKKGTVAFRAEKYVETDEDRRRKAEQQVEERIEKVLGPTFGVTLDVTVTQWQSNDEKDRNND